MTQRDIAKDKEMCEAATAGPWRWSGKSGIEGDGWFPVGDLEHPTAPRSADMLLTVELNIHGFPEIHCWFEANRDFITEARQALPYWISQYEALYEATRVTLESFERITADMETEYRAACARIKVLERRIRDLEREEEEPRPRFRMDANGNLTRIEDDE